jgi:hypothetical protein
LTQASTYCVSDTCETSGWHTGGKNDSKTIISNSTGEEEPLIPTQSTLPDGVAFEGAELQTSKQDSVQFFGLKLKFRLDG